MGVAGGQFTGHARGEGFFPSRFRLLRKLGFLHDIYYKTFFSFLERNRPGGEVALMPNVRVVKAALVRVF